MAIDPAFTADMQRTVTAQIPNIVPAADNARASALGVAAALLAAQQTSLAIHRARTVMKYGVDSDQVTRIDTRAAALTATETAVGQSRASGNIQAPEVPSGSAALFGQVTGEDGAAIKGATVLAVNQSGTALCEASTQPDGTYQIVLQVRATERDCDDARIAAAASPGLSVHLQVQIGGKVVFNSAETLMLRSGDIVMRNLVVTPPGSDTAAA
jgi:hypothetical protein